MNRERWLVLGYGLAVVSATLVHDPQALAAGLFAVLLAAGRQAPSIFLRALRAVLLFNVAVSLGYALLAWLQQKTFWDTLLLLNLRVLLLTLLTFLFITRVDLFRALGFSPALTYLLGLAYSQTLAFRRAHEDFRLALASRAIARPRLRDRYLSSAAAASWLLERGLATARETAQALRSRGFFHD